MGDILSLTIQPITKPLETLFRSYLTFIERGTNIEKRVKIVSKSKKLRDRMPRRIKRVCPACFTNELMQKPEVSRKKT